MGRELRVNRATTTAQGLVPAPGSATGKFLRDDLTWATAGGGSSTALPGTINNLVLWFDASAIKSAASSPLPKIGDSNPVAGGVIASNRSSGFPNVTVSSVGQQINGLNTAHWPSSSNFGLQIVAPIYLQSCTLFVVCRGNTPGGGQAFIGGDSGAITLYLYGGTQQIALSKTNITGIGTSTASWVAGTAFQANATYDTTTGNYAFRQTQASAGSGTGASGAGGGLQTFIGAEVNVSTSVLLNAEVGEFIIYNRVLTLAEIQSVEAYLFSKWGV